MPEIAITPYNKHSINAGKICPYCGASTLYRDSKIIYGTSYGMIYICLPCNAYVGCHRNSNVALGRLADAELRSWKKQAHWAFDPIWMKRVAEGQSRYNARNQAYRWLSEQMKLPLEETHIGMFNLAQCKRVVDICKSQ